MKLLVKIVAAVLVLAMVAGVALIVVNSGVKKEFGIDLFKTVRQLKKLGDDVNVSKIAPNAFADEDMADVMEIFNGSLENIVTYDENGYSINLDDLSGEMKAYVRLTDRQLGAMADQLLKQELGGKIALGEHSIGISVLQMDIVNDKDSTTLLNIVVALDISELADTLPNVTGIERIKSHIPDMLYISSTVSVEKGSEAFTYTVTDAGIKVNNLTAEDTADLLHILDVLFKIGDAEKLNLAIGNTLMDVLVGNEVNVGIAYSLKDVGAVDFDFVSIEAVDYYKIKIEKSLT